MKIRSIRWQGFRVPFARPLDEAHPDRFGMIIRLETDDGFVGLGEPSYPGFGSEEANEAIAEALRETAGRLAFGELPTESGVPSLPPELPGPLRFGLETALGDIIGKTSKAPLARCIGGETRPLPVNALVTAGDPATAVAQVTEALQSGITAFKMKVARLSPEAELNILNAIRETAGPDAKIRIDAKGAWTQATAVVMLEGFAAVGIEYCEQPLPAGDTDSLARVRARSPIPIAADESITGWDAARRLMEADACDLFIVKAARTGFTETLRILRESRERAWKAVLTTSLEAGVGVASSLHLTSLTDSATPSGLATLPLLKDDLITERVEVVDGCISVPTGDGLGVTVDEDALRRYATAQQGALDL